MIGYDPKNWLAVVFRFRGTVIPRVAGRTLFVAAISIGLYLLREKGIIDLAIPAAAHAMVGVALGLLLVFRTNASFDRYWEGRKLLGGIVNTVRNLRRQAAAYIEEDAGTEVARLGRLWLRAVFRSLRLEALDEDDLEEATAEERAEIERAVSPALVIAARLSSLIASEAKAGRLSEERLRMIDENIDQLIDVLGGAERIVKTPVPFAYAHHIKTFLSLFCLTAPLALLGGMGALTPVAATIVAFGLYGIDEIGVEIEDPFGDDDNDLPMVEIFTALAKVLDELEP